MHLRISKLLLVAAATLFATLVVFNNVTDYGSNLEFVRHVLSMDTTFPDNNGMWRRIESPLLHHAAYVLIILTEAVIAILGWAGVSRMWRFRDDAPAFNTAKVPAIWALSGGILLWFGGFMAVGGEWFLMWQSESWNAQGKSAMFSTIYGVILLYVVQEDR
jgi:predicted small integral membrane protein